MRRRHSEGAVPGVRGVGRGVVLRTKGGLRKGRLHSVILAGLVVIVQLAWGVVLVYLGFHFL
jgi:hypothetical protein